MDNSRFPRDVLNRILKFSGGNSAVSAAGRSHDSTGCHFMLNITKGLFFSSAPIGKAQQGRRFTGCPEHYVDKAASDLLLNRLFSVLFKAGKKLSSLTHSLRPMGVKSTEWSIKLCFRFGSNGRNLMRKICFELDGTNSTEADVDIIKADGTIMFLRLKMIPHTLWVEKIQIRPGGPGFDLVPYLRMICAQDRFEDTFLIFTHFTQRFHRSSRNDKAVLTYRCVAAGFFLSRSQSRYEFVNPDLALDGPDPDTDSQSESPIDAEPTALHDPYLDQTVLHQDSDTESSNS